MQGQEALFSENMTLKEVIERLKQQQSAKTPTQETARTQWQTPQDIFLTTGQENTENSQNNFWNATEVNIEDSCTRNEKNSLVFQKEQLPEHEKEGVSFQFPLNARYANQGNSSHHVELLSAPTSQDVSMEEQPAIFSKTNISEDTLDGYNTSTNAIKVNSGDIIPRNDMDSSLIIHRMYHPEPEMGNVSYGVPQDSTRASQRTFTCLQGTLGISFTAEEPRGVPGFLPRPEQLSSEPLNLCRNHDANLTRETHQDSFHRDIKPYKCDECPSALKYACKLSSHQKTHQNKRAFICPTCQKIFNHVSDLRRHESIHKPKKPLICSTCKRSFSHKTNMKAHERIHTGEKPYTCSLCKISFRQSSSYYRHLRNYHKSE